MKVGACLFINSEEFLVLIVIFKVNFQLYIGIFSVLFQIFSLLTVYTLAFFFLSFFLSFFLMTKANLRWTVEPQVQAPPPRCQTERIAVYFKWFCWLYWTILFLSSRCLLAFSEKNGFVCFFSFDLERQRRLRSRKMCLFHSKVCLFYRILGPCFSVLKICLRTIVAFGPTHRTGW